MKRRIAISPEAELDLDQIWEFIARDSVNAADRVQAEIEAALILLSELPGIGHLRNDVHNTRFRFWSVYSYLIGYTYDADEL